MKPANRSLPHAAARGAVRKSEEWMGEAKKSMAPVGADEPSLIILGSLPGEASLAAGRYYAHPQNQFWRLLGAAIGEPLAALEYEQRLALLGTRGIALWDVVGEALRTGSIDGALRAVSTNPIERFVAEHPSVRAIAFNGGTAARLGRRALGDAEGLLLVDLPSSSPAYTLAFDAKLARWTQLGDLALARKAATLG